MSRGVLLWLFFVYKKEESFANEGSCSCINETSCFKTGKHPARHAV